MSGAQPGKAIDGRRLRTERSRQAIIDAALALLQEGTLVPTAQQVADRAGLGIRSFFRHFEDMEALVVAVDAQIRDRLDALFRGGDRRGTLSERIQHAVQRRGKAYDTVAPIVLSTLAQRWRFEFLRSNYARQQRRLRRDLDDWLPELRALPDERREAIDAVTSFEFWHRLREHQGLSRRLSVEIVSSLLRELLSPR